MDLTSLLENKYFQGIFLLLVGGFIKAIYDKFFSKTKTIYYTIHSERIALSANDPIFGNIKIEWQNNPVDNLYNTIIEIENTTSIDFREIELKVITPSEIFILGDVTSIVNTSRILERTKKYQEKLYVETGKDATQYQIDSYFHEREYIIPVFNRGQKIQLRFLTTAKNNAEHYIFIEVLHSGVKFVQRFANNKIHNVLIQDALLWGILACILILFLCVLYLDNIWIITSICMFAGAIAQSIGALIYKVISFIRKAIIQ